FATPEHMNSRSDSAVFVAHSYALNDPPQFQAASSLAQSGWKVTILQLPPQSSFPSLSPASVETQAYSGSAWIPKRPAALSRLLHWNGYKRFIRRGIATLNPKLVVTHMLHAVAALPNKRDFCLV